MIQTLGAKEGDEITIEKCVDGEMSFFKVNGLSMNDMNNAGSVDKVNEAKPKSSNNELQQLREENQKLKDKIKTLESEQLSASDIPF